MAEERAWYAAGLQFECVQCGNCCAGPDEGYIWISKPEIEMLAEYLKLSVDTLRARYLTRYGPRMSIRERAVSHDCVFLKKTTSGRGCGVYPVRPNQCRTWPFWTSNLRSAEEWKHTARKCPGIGRGRFHSFEQIEAIRLQDRWWQAGPDEIAERVKAIYRQLDQQIDAIRTLRGGGCDGCGQCCDFDKYDHRLYVSTPEMIYFQRAIAPDSLRPMQDGICPYRHGGHCSVHGHRFSGCRIFFCDSGVSPELQSELSEWAVGQFKALCQEMGLEYRYCDLAKALNRSEANDRGS
ncbi:MAG: YkgJ family cysteine cluster protein [Phycisphaerae bacterium]|nr:YkgJ family cysteine cluster protein [Phycisphaerae bacterium]